MIPSVMSRNSSREIFSINICEACIRKSTLVNLRGNGDVIYDIFKSAPKHMFIDLQKRSLNSDRSIEIHVRAKTAKLFVLKNAKDRRNTSRYMICKTKAAPYNVRIGSYTSWGFGDNFDEYFGKLSTTGIPHGFGVKFYSDGTVYVGDWVNGRQHTSGRGLWTRPNGSSYEGNWMQGRKHGHGEQSYADGRVYIGEFAGGFEHGHGRINYPDGGYFEGRFRFGRRDGPGTFKPRDGHIQKGIFRDKAVTPEAPPPEVVEVDEDNPTFAIPDTLQKISLDFIAIALHAVPCTLPSPNRIQTHCPSFLKPLIGSSYLSKMSDGGAEFCRFGQALAYSNEERLALRDIRMTYNDVEALVTFTENNNNLRTLHVVNCSLKGPRAEVLCRTLMRDLWPRLADLDLSFSRLEHRTLDVLMSGLRGRSTLRRLRLAGCHIDHSYLAPVGDFLSANSALDELDLAFNNLSLAGAKTLSDALSLNTTLTLLNVRHNSIGRDGGAFFADLLRRNRTLKILVVADNHVGEDVMAMISARLNGNIEQIKSSIAVGELKVPEKYLPHNYGVLRRQGLHGSVIDEMAVTDL